jgi:uncharacterized protein RhaS with RHS repeats
LYLATYRGYNPFTARWLNRDPIEENGGLNLYEYVGGDPIGYIDPDGLKPPKDIPPHVNPRKNISEASSMPYRQWYNAVRNKGKWDYKQQDPKYQNFGNYNFGLTSRAVGIPGGIPNRGAGWAQQKAGTSLLEWGSPYDIPPSIFGDDPEDQYWINEGIKDYESGYRDEECQQ